MVLIRDDNRVTKLVTKYMCQYILKNDTFSRLQRNLHLHLLVYFFFECGDAGENLIKSWDVAV